MIFNIMKSWIQCQSLSDCQLEFPSFKLHHKGEKKYMPEKSERRGGEKPEEGNSHCLGLSFVPSGSLSRDGSQHPEGPGLCGLLPGRATETRAEFPLFSFWWYLVSQAGPCDQETWCSYPREVLSHIPRNLDCTCDLLSPIGCDRNGTVPISGLKKASQLPLVCSYHVRSPATLLGRVHLERS